MDVMIREKRQEQRREKWERRQKEIEARCAQNEETKTLRTRLKSTEHAMVEHVRLVTKRVERVMDRLGYHRPDRGRWRRRRTMSNEPAVRDVRQLTADNLGRTVESMLIDQLGDQIDGRRDEVCAKLQAIRRVLAPPGSTLAECMLAERASLCWLHCMIGEMDRAEMMRRLQIGRGNDRQCTMIDACLSRAQARLEHSLIALSKVRRLKLPRIINQVNIGTQANGAIQVSGH
jgi:hypothetical protein